jgi:hypothetical protein
VETATRTGKSLPTRASALTGRGKKRRKRRKKRRKKRKERRKKETSHPRR